MVDGMNVPVNVTFELVDIKRGEEAYNILLKGKTDLEPAENGMEYILITLNISYVSGEADTVTLWKIMPHWKKQKCILHYLMEIAMRYR